MVGYVILPFQNPNYSYKNTFFSQNHHPNSSWGSSESEEGLSIATDDSGNIYITGWTNATSTGNDDVFLAKYNSSGAQKWNATWGGDGNEYGNDIIVDDSGNIYITGSIISPGEEDSDVFLLKYNCSGIRQWNITWGNKDDDSYPEGYGDDNGYGICIDGLNRIYLTGISWGRGPDAFLAQFNSSGSEQWNTTWRGVSEDAGLDVAVDSMHNIYIVGEEGLDSDILLAQYNSSGIQQWNTTCGTGGVDRGYGIAIDNSNNIYIAGRILLGMRGEAFIAQYNTSGIQIWNTSWGSTDWEWGLDITIDNLSNKVYMTGATESFGNGKLDAFLVQYSSSGIQQWNSTLGGIEEEESWGVALVNSNKICIVGRTESFGNGKVDGFIAQYNSSGALIWSDPIFSSDNDNNPLIPLGQTESQQINSLLIILLISIGAGIVVGMFGLFLYNRRKRRNKDLDEKSKKAQELKVKKQILELSRKFPKLQILEIAERTGEEPEVLTEIIIEMIQNKELYAEYFKNDQEVEFDQEGNIKEIDKLIDTYKDWEKEGTARKQE
jgi:uncharacterized delta-60 repeat protein